MLRISYTRDQWCALVIIPVLLQMRFIISGASGQAHILGVPLGSKANTQLGNQWKTMRMNDSAVRPQSQFRMNAFVDSNDGETNYEQSRAFHSWIEETLERYDNRLRPFFGVKELRIQLGMHLMGISSISETTMEFTAELFFHETWRDPRLRFDPAKFGNADIMTLPLGAPQSFWIPDTAFLNALRSQSPNPGSASHLYYMKLSSNGTLYYSRRLSITAECQFDLTMYPFDQQACRLELSSYGFTVDDIVYEWVLRHDSVLVDQIELADFYVPHFTAKIVNKTFASGTFSAPQLCFVFTRRWGFCLLNLFIPATAVVGSSWISLWLQNETQFADMVAVILAIVFLACSYNTILPKVSYVKATDIYLAACFIFAFLSLVKLAVVKYLHNLTTRRKERMQEAASSNLLAALAGEHMSMLAAQALEAKNSNDRLHVGSINADASSTTEMPELARGNRAMQSSTGNLHNVTVAGGNGNVDKADRLIRAIHLFHVGSQLILPIAFAAFGVFYFLIYPNVPSKGVCN